MLAVKAPVMRPHLRVAELTKRICTECKHPQIQHRRIRQVSPVHSVPSFAWQTAPSAEAGCALPVATGHAVVAGNSEPNRAAVQPTRQMIQYECGLHWDQQTALVCYLPPATDGFRRP
jgi:hypothetical protein